MTNGTKKIGYGVTVIVAAIALFVMGRCSGSADAPTLETTITEVQKGGSYISEGINQNKAEQAETSTESEVTTKTAK